MMARLARAAPCEQASVIAPAARTCRHIVFDLDGTLVDSNAVCVAILQEMLTERGSGRIINLVEARPFMSQGGMRMVSGLLAHECLDPAAELIEFRARYLARTASADTLFSGVLPGLADLEKAGFTMAICSNKPQALCEKVLSDTGIATFMHAIVGSVPERAPKPAPDALHAVLDMLDRDPADCIFVGDSDLDYRVARNADMPFAFMTYGYTEAGWTPRSEPDWHLQASESFDHFGHLVEALIAGARARP